MPIYEYACTKCGHEFEALVRTTTVPGCPDCHSTELQKKLSVFATPGSVPQAATPVAAGPCGGACACAAAPQGCGLN